MIMNAQHPEWHEFLHLVDEGLEPEVDDEGAFSWKPSGDFRLASAACRKLGLTGDEIIDSVEFWRSCSVFNDDEIMLNLEVLEAA